MAGVALLVDLWRKNPSFSTKALHSHDLLSKTFAVSAATAAAASFSSGQTLASRFLFGGSGISVAYSDAGAEFAGDYLSKLRNISGSISWNESIKYSTKVYPIELKPIFSAFAPKALAMTTVRSFLLFYLPLLEPASIRDDDDDFPEEAPVRPDLVAPLKKSVKQIIRETSVGTTRRVLERLAVHYASQRMAWKLIKDVPKSAKRKALRGMSSSDYFYSISRTTFRGHFLAIAASWLVQVGIEIYRCFSGLTNREEAENVDSAGRIKIFGMKVVGVTFKCSASLICASIGAGIGSTFIHPSIGAIIGCTVGDIAGPFIIIFCIENGLSLNLRS